MLCQISRYMGKNQEHSDYSLINNMGGVIPQHVVL